MRLALLLILAGLVGYWAAQQRVHLDISQNGRNSLNQASIDILQALDGPVEVTVYATRQDPKLGDIRGVISGFISNYQRFKPDINVHFVDPAEHPQQAQAAGVRLNGELVVRFDGREAKLTSINEQAFTNLLMHLARQRIKQLNVLSGHGERKFNGIANRDLGDFGKKLAAIGFKAAPFNLMDNEAEQGSDDILVIASPQIGLLAGEVDRLLDYLSRGGNLLWLVDSGEELYGLQPLAETLGISFTPGVIVDPQAKQLNAPFTFMLGIDYQPHVITQNFDFITVFPFARQLVIEENSQWRHTVLVEGASQGWVETAAITDELTFDENADVRGPFSVAVTLSRIVDDREQRIIVVGSGHFLANTYLGNGGNLDLGVNMLNWLADDERLITIQPRATIDHRLVLSQSELNAITIISLIGLPLLFLVSGILINWRRRRW
ncbi:MAG: DUF4350 domain-containing protein [Nitrosomonas sp.]|nr:DUF4350 domain-containing protein [Nitrosomonas sp.]